MLIKEILTAPAQPAIGAEVVAVPTATTQAVEPTPTPKDIADIQALIGTIDPVKEQPHTLLNKLNGWMKQYPLLDKVTDIIPQTRLIKAIAAAADAIEAGDSRTALNALAGAVGGQLANIAKAVNVGTAVAQGDVKGAALAAGGTIANVAKGVGAVSSLAQGDLAGAVGNVNKGAGNAVASLQAKMAPTAQPTATQTAAAPDELARIKQLANVQPA
jgi:hypothetical protein